MISNERPLPSGYRPYVGGFAKAPTPDSVLKSADIEIERKKFTITLRENPKGRFLRITENANGRYDNIIVPSTGLEEFRRVLDEMTKAASEIPEVGRRTETTERSEQLGV